MFNPKIFICLLLPCIFTVSVFAGSEDAKTAGSDITLKRALSLTEQHNPELAAYSTGIKATRAEQLQSSLKPNPELEVEMENVGGTGGHSGLDTLETAVMLSQLVEVGGKLEKRRDVSRLGVKIADLDYQHKRISVFSEVQKAYFKVLQAQQQEQLTSEILELSRESLRIVTLRVESGRDSPVEISQARVTLSRAESSHEQARRDLKYAKRQLSGFWGSDEPQFDRALGDFQSLDVPANETALKAALESTPRIKSNDVLVSQKRAELELERARAKGDITIGGGVKWMNESDDASLLFGISIPLPVNSRNQGTIQAASYRLAMAKRGSMAARQELLNQFNAAYLELSSAFENAEALRDNILPESEKIYNTVLQSYREGKTDFLRVIEAQQALFDVKSEYVSCLLRYHLANAELDRLCTLNPRANQTVNKFSGNINDEK
ncbi:Cation efflux system protein CzcC [Limihaloglobus sulfuriphilus]|uniref:Cation efflux system protein CzcC n=1 Tax=Limihaloglobus sulfuriphilus TaxID=1851148 RepID=A0A1Q2MGN6_9BACT|nr:TolC family protein [Limihaloglobus sulfuriphilus]AQQ71851.1 Cation efflux system protein CzcC [Limihaloglobus sulfuriphilus]